MIPVQPSLHRSDCKGMPLPSGKFWRTRSEVMMATAKSRYPHQEAVFLTQG